MFNLLHTKINQKLYEKHLCNQSSHYEKYVEMEAINNTRMKANYKEKDILQ